MLGKYSVSLLIVLNVALLSILGVTVESNDNFVQGTKTTEPRTLTPIDPYEKMRANVEAQPPRSIRPALLPQTLELHDMRSEVKR